MKKLRLGSCICVGVLAVSLGIAGCGNNQTAASTSDSNAASSANNSSAEQKEPRTLYWRGTTDTGRTFYFMEDEAAKTADVLVIPAEEEEGEDREPFHIEGNYSLSADGTATITEPEEESEEESSSKERETYVFSITDVNETSLLIDAGEYGKATLTPISEGEHKEILVAYGYATADEPSEEGSEE